MKEKVTGALYLLPRVLSLIMIVFTSVFALDVFGQLGWFVALLMHLVPSFVLVILTIFSWRRGRIGGIIFLIFGALLAVFTHFETYFISISLIMIGIFYIISDIYKHKTIKRSDE